MFKFSFFFTYKYFIFLGFVLIYSVKGPTYLFSHMSTQESRHLLLSNLFHHPGDLKSLLCTFVCFKTFHDRWAWILSVTLSLKEEFICYIFFKLLLFLTFWLQPTAYGMLVSPPPPKPRIEPTPPALEARVLTSGPPGNPHCCCFAFNYGRGLSKFVCGGRSRRCRRSVEAQMGQEGNRAI